jgi:hypothetical protein
MHFLAISLLAILAGTLLLAKTRKEELGKFFTFISWFFIVVGFLLFIGGGICHFTHCCKPGPPECRQEMILKDCDRGMFPGPCCPADKCKETCAHKDNCMQHDSMMKNCPEHMKGDTAKIPVPNPGKPVKPNK